MQSQRFLDANKKISLEAKIFVTKNLALIEQIHCILESKGWTQKIFAAKLNKSESEISKWLSGSHNFTCQSICKMEAILEKDLLITPNSYYHKFTATVGVYAKRVEQKVTQIFFESGSTIIYDGSIDIKADGKTIVVQKEKKMILDKQLGKNDALNLLWNTGESTCQKVLENESRVA